MNNDSLVRPLVSLVGAGPGDPELITVKGLDRLLEADIVLYDALVSPELLEHARMGAELIYAGKHPGRHSISQEAIHALLVKHVQAGRRVVRLKGGDPYIFGKGAEEALFLKARGIRVEVIPGITSAVAVPAAAGIPLTHRGISSSFAVMTGHRTEDNRPVLVPQADTLVYLMCVSNLENIVRSIAGERGQWDLPCAVIESGTTKRQKVITGALRNIVGRSKRAKLEPPAVLVVGEVVRLRGPLR